MNPLRETRAIASLLHAERVPAQEPANRLRPLGQLPLLPLLRNDLLPPEPPGRLPTRRQLLPTPPPFIPGQGDLVPDLVGITDVPGGPQVASPREGMLSRNAHANNKLYVCSFAQLKTESFVLSRYSPIHTVWMSKPNDRGRNDPGSRPHAQKEQSATSSSRKNPETLDPQGKNNFTDGEDLPVSDSKRALVTREIVHEYTVLLKNGWRSSKNILDCFSWLCSCQYR